MKSLSIMIHDVNCMSSLISGGRQVARLPGSVELGELKIVAPELTRCHGMLSDSCNVSRSLISSITLPIRSSFFASDFASRIAVFGCICFVCIAIAPQALPDGGRDGDSSVVALLEYLRSPYARDAFPISRFPDFPISRFPDFATF